MGESQSTFPLMRMGHYPAWEPHYTHHNVEWAFWQESAEVDARTKKSVAKGPR